MQYIYDDGGRSAAGFKGAAGDCVTRAIAIAAHLSYQSVYDGLKAFPESRHRGKSSPRTGVRKSTVKAFLRSLGWHWTPTMGIGTGCRVHLRDGELPMGRLIVSVSRHEVAVIDGVIHDTYDPSRDETRCVYGYWQAAR